MNVEVRLFAVVKQLAGSEHLTLDLPEGARVADLREALCRQVPAVRTLAEQLMFAVEEEYVTAQTPLTAGITVACIPPVSGG